MSLLWCLNNFCIQETTFDDSDEKTQIQQYLEKRSQKRRQIVVIGVIFSMYHFKTKWTNQNTEYLQNVVVGVFYTGKIQGGQDHAFEFQWGLVNYKTHGDLSWFKLLLGGNSPTSSGLILKMNRCYKGWSESSRSSCGEGENGSRTPCLTP
jgi:hypothetical protein